METKNMLAFKKRDAKAVATRLGYIISEKGEIMGSNEVVACYSCDNPLTIDNLGVISSGSKIAFCDNPACYAKYLAGKETEGSK